MRRDVLERLSFPIGYGVETSHVIDVYTEWGLQAFGQTDLDQRVHRHHATRDLGKMAFGILHTFLNRPRSRGIVPDLPTLTPILRQFQAREENYEQVLFEIREEERPPMIDIDAYRRMRGAIS